MTDPTTETPEILTAVGPTPTDPDPHVRNAYFAQVATEALALGERCGLHFAVELAIRNHWYDGMQAGIEALAANQRRAHEEAEAVREAVLRG